MKEQPFTHDFLKRFAENKLSPLEYEDLLIWLSAQPKAAQLEFMESHIEALDLLVTENIRPEFDNLQQLIERNRGRRQQILLWTGRAAAALLLPLMIYIGTTNKPVAHKTSVAYRKTNPTPIRMLRVTNLGSSDYKLTLDDWSEVTLSQGATLYYPEKFDHKKRALSLTGDAFFKVRHETSRSFTITSGNIRTTVLGTSFWIKAVASSPKISVLVKTGKVGVQHDAEPTIFLLPGQSAVYQKSAGKLTKVLPENIKNSSSISMPARAALAFNGTSLKNVIAELTLNYGLKFVLETDVDQEQKLTLNTKGMDIAAIMVVLKNQLPVNYEIKGKTVHIKNK